MVRSLILFLSLILVAGTASAGDKPKEGDKLVGGMSEVFMRELDYYQIRAGSRQMRASARK
jgi:hypothetical protein